MLTRFIVGLIVGTLLFSCSKERVLEPTTQADTASYPDIKPPRAPK